MCAHWIDQPAAVRRGEEIDAERLQRYLQGRLSGLEGPLVIQQFPRGFSNLTYLLSSGERQLVLRRPPYGAAIKTAHDMSREYKILSRLVHVYPKVPRPLHLCEDTAVLGAPFYVMERVEGVVLRSDMPAAMRPPPQRMRAIAAALVETFGELHAVDVAAAGLQHLGRPEGYVRRQIEGWTERYLRARTDDVPEIETAADWLAANLPREQGTSLIHNDFKYDNLVLDAEDWSRILAILDWEMATVGDPLMDLGTSLGYWVEAEDPPELKLLGLAPTLLPGNPTRVELVERYSVATGRDVGNVVFYYVYGLFKVAVIIQQIYARYRAGHTRDERFARLIDGVRVCGRIAVQAIGKGRIDHLFTT